MSVKGFTMCRLMFVPGFARISRKSLRVQLDHLENSCGGDGNGYLAVRIVDGGPVETRLSKGVMLSNARISREVVPLIRAGWSVYYHTRKVSVGWVSDEQCHPFAINGKKWVGAVVHNGTWYDGGTLAKWFNVGSDTAALAKALGQLGPDELEKRDLMPTSGIFLLFGGKPGETPCHNVLKLSGDLAYCATTGIWASEFCPTWTGRTYLVAGGKHCLEKPAPEYVPPVYVSKVSYPKVTYSKSTGKFRTGYASGDTGKASLDRLTTSSSHSDYDRDWTYVDRGFGFHS